MPRTKESRKGLLLTADGSECGTEATSSHDRELLRCGNDEDEVSVQQESLSEDESMDSKAEHPIPLLGR